MIRNRLNPIRLVLALGLGLSLSAPSRAEGPARDYMLSIESELQIKLRDQPQLLEAVTTLQYAVQTTGLVEQVALHTLGVTIRDANRILTQSSLSRAGAKLQQGVQPATVIEFRNAPPALQERLAEFDTPLARVTTDPEGRETARDVVLKPDSPLVKAGIIDNLRLFHAPYPRDAPEWEAPASLSLGNGQHAHGTLRYEKLLTEPGPGGTMRVKVSGELRAEGSVGIGELRNGSYRVSGEQVYDPAIGAWASGRLDLDVSFELYSAGQAIGTGSGPIQVTLVLLKDGPAAKLSAEPEPPADVTPPAAPQPAAPAP